MSTASTSTTVAAWMPTCGCPKSASRRARSRSPILRSTAVSRTACARPLFWARYGGKPIVLSSNLEFCQKLWSAYREEADRHGPTVAPGQEAGWGGILVTAPSDAEAQEWAADMRWFWERWSVPFGQGLPEMLVGSPDTLSRRIEQAGRAVAIDERSEERRVGKEGRSRWSPDH